MATSSLPANWQSRYSNTHLVWLLKNRFLDWHVQEGKNEYTVPEFLAFWKQYNGESPGPQVWYRWTADSTAIEVFEDDGTLKVGQRLALLTPHPHGVA